MIVLRPRTRLAVWLRVSMLIVALPVAACGGGGGGGGSAPPPQRQFINWVDSTNGTVVVDYDNEPVQFYADTGTLWFRGIEFLNVTVNASADIYWNGQMIGGVYYVWSTENEVITAVVSNNFTMIDLYQNSAGYAWASTNVSPQFYLTLEPDPPLGLIDPISRMAQTAIFPPETVEQGSLLLQTVLDVPDDVGAYGLLLGPAIGLAPIELPVWPVGRE